MTFNKIESGLMKLTKANVPIQPYVNDVVNTFAAEAREKGIEIEIRDINRSTDKNSKGSSVQSSVNMNKLAKLDEKAMEQSRTRWTAATRRLVKTSLLRTSVLQINVYLFDINTHPFLITITSFHYYVTTRILSFPMSQRVP